LAQTQVLTEDSRGSSTAHKGENMDRYVRAIGVVIFSMVIVVSLTGVSYGSVAGPLLTGSSGTVTTTSTSLTFNPDSAAIGTACPSGGSPCNNDVATGTVLTFNTCASGALDTAGCLATREGLIVQTLSAAAVNPNAAFITFASHPNLDFSLTGITVYGPGTANSTVTSNCATITTGQNCVIFPGAAVLLTQKSSTSSGAAVDLQGRASDTGLGGLATGNLWTGGWSVTLTQPLPNGATPTPANIQLFFCGTNNVTSAAQCNNGASLSTSNAGTFFVTPTATVPEPESIALTMIGSGLIGLGVWRRRKARG
jgi:hypothetical protein